MRGLGSSILLSAVFGLSACSDDDGVVVDLGVIIAPDHAEARIEHSALVEHGVDVQVTVMTYGDDCTTADRTDVEVSGLVAIIRPFDKSATRSVCADTLFSYEHVATIRFEQAGAATISVLGYDTGDRFGTVIERSTMVEIK